MSCPTPARRARPCLAALAAAVLAAAAPTLVHAQTDGGAASPAPAAVDRKSVV